MSSYRVTRVNIWQHGGHVMRAIPEGHRLHPGDGPRDVFERYREVDEGHEMQRTRDRGHYGSAARANPLAYLPDFDELTLPEAVRAHHRMQMKHAQAGHGSSALDLYRLPDRFREIRKHQPGKIIALDGVMHTVLVMAPRTAALLKEPADRTLDDCIAWLFADDHFVGALPMDFAVSLNVDHDPDDDRFGCWELGLYPMVEPPPGMYAGHWGGGYYIEVVHRPDRPHPEVTYIEDYCIDPADGNGDALIRTLWQFMGEPAPDGPDTLWRNPAYPHHDLPLPAQSRRAAVRMSGNHTPQH